MNVYNIDILLEQEIWLTGTYSKVINNYQFIYYRLNKAISSRGECRVVIILSPIATKAYKEAREVPPKILCSDHNLVLDSWILSIKLNFKGIIY